MVAHGHWTRLLDLALALAAAYAVLHVIINGDLIARRLGRLHPTDITASVIGLLVTLELARRTIGALLPGIAIACVGLALFGTTLAEASGGAYGSSLGRIVLAAWVGTDGVFGVAFGVMVGVVYVYMLLAALLERSGGTQALLQLAAALTRRSKSGAGMTTVVSSGLFGMASGSGVADVAAVGTANIPAMKQAGYSPPFAASVQALASIGAQVMPPVMGSSAFILAELTSTPYGQVALMGLLPALLFYACVAAAVHFESRRIGIIAETQRHSGLSAGRVILAISPLGILIAMLVSGSSPSRAALFAVAAVHGLGVLRGDGALTPRTLWQALREGTVSSIPLWTATATIGIIVSTVSMTGLTNEISLAVVALSKHSLFLSLIAIMAASLVLGTALPTIAAYLLLVVMVAPALQELGVPLIVAHFFIFYYGVTSDLTPPTALAPLTASVLAEANFWDTCWHTMRIGLPIFALPFAFVYQPALLLMGTPAEIVTSFLSCLCACIVFAAGAVGWFGGALGLLGRVVLMSAGMMMIVPSITILIIALMLVAATGLIGKRAPRMALRMRLYQ
jgi:TRAP transporter 4TM/12TM fusion protein